MGKSLFCFAWSCFALVAIVVAPAQAYLLTSRWSRTATNPSTGTQGTPITLTWSFPADGVLIPGNTMGTTVANNLQNFLDTNWGIGPGGSDLTQRPWFPIFEQSFARIGALSGVTYVYEPHDDGASFSDSLSGRGVLGARGDIRLGGRSYGAGSKTLASNYYPQYGEMMINTDQTSYLHNSANNYRGFRNTLMHESMHGLGIEHVESSTSGFLIEPILSTAFDGPQLDDLLAIQRQYGDAYEKDGGNDVFGNATPLEEVSELQPISIGTPLSGTVIQGDQVGFLSIDDDSDTDFFRFSLSSRLDVQLNLTPQGTSYLIAPQTDPPTTQTSFDALALSDLSLALLGSNGTSILDSANLNAAGAGESIARRLLPGTYYARVKGLTNDIQLYNLGISATLPTAGNLVWVGGASQNWDVGNTTNFSDGGSPAAFYAGDNVNFDDSSPVKTVHITQDVAAGNIRVETAGAYVFAGAGGIVAGNLVVDGMGTVELANSGNSYDGDTQVLAGTLAITGNANAMRSAITIADGATLRMDADDASAMTSSFTIQSGGTLQIGTLASTTNVFPDHPAAVVDEGTIRVLTTESLSGVNGAGGIDIEHGTTTLAANPGIVGALAVKAGATAQIAGRADLGSDAVHVVVESGGSLQLAEGGMFSQAFQLDSGATLEVSGVDDFQESARLSGSGHVMGDLSMPGTIAPAGGLTAASALEIAGNLALAETSRVEYELAGPTAGIDFTPIQIDGTATLSGTLAAVFAGDFAATHDNSFELLTAAGGLSGVFDSLLLPALDQGFEWTVIYNADSIVLHFSAPVQTLPGDFNLDGTVDAADYTVWRDGLDTLYTQDDYVAWKTHFGQTTNDEAAGAGAVQSAVPEPPAYLVALAGILGALVTRPRAGRTRIA